MEKTDEFMMGVLKVFSFAALAGLLGGGIAFKDAGYTNIMSIVTGIGVFVIAFVSGIGLVKISQWLKYENEGEEGFKNDISVPPF